MDQHLEDHSVSAYLRSHPKFLQEWLERNAGPELLEKVQKQWDKNQEIRKSSGEKNGNNSQEAAAASSLELPNLR